MEIKINKLFLTFCLICLFSTLPAPAQENLPNLDLRSTLLYTDHWAYKYIQLLQERGFLRELYYSVKPYNRTDLAKALKSLPEERLSVPEKYWANLIKKELKFELGLFSSENDNPESVIKIKTTFEAESNKRYGHLETDYSINPEVHFVMEYLAVSARGRIDNGLLNDPAYSGRKTNLLGARLEDGYGIIYLGKMNLFIGRTAQNWAPFANKSLLLSNNPYTYDQLGLNFETKHIAFHSVFAKLNSVKYNDQIADRYFSAHRLDVKLNNGMNLGFSESVIYGGPDQSIEFSYINPFSIFMNAQTNEKKEANENIAFDFFIPFRQFNFIGQILIDDFILDGPDKPAPNRKTSSDRLGFLFGVNGNDLVFKNTLWTLHYERIGSYTYNVKQKRPWQTYTNDGQGLGHGANDRDAWELNLQYFPVPRWIFDVEATYTRQGARNLLSNNFEDSTFVKLPFPSGVVEKTASLSACALYQSERHIFAEARIGVDNTLNYKHIKKNQKTSLFFLIRLNFQIDRNINNN